MNTKCPDCSAVFRVTTEQLNMADGLVRCGICDSVFNGKDYIEQNYNLIIAEQHDNDNQPVVDDGWSNNQADADDHGLENQTDDDALIDADRIPSVIRDDFGDSLLKKTNGPIQTAVFTLGAIALALFFFGQISYWQNINILPRSWVNNFCKPLSCDENNQRDVTVIKILNRNIYTHPNVNNALMITASFVNQSQSAQTYPLLEITLLDTHGQIIAVRRFSPKDYLVNKSLADTLMPPNQPVGARLEVLDPDNKVIAYEFEFY